MNKPLSEWTLGEVQKYCKNTQCGDCCIGLWCENMNKGPSDWDLSEPPRWTEQDKEDARALRRLIPDAYILYRYSANTFLKLYDRDDNFIMNLNDCFPVLPLGKKVTLYEIIGGAE